MAHLSFPPPTDHQEFERVVAEIAGARWRGASVTLNGRTGQAQKGVDVNVLTHEGRHIGIQCKLTGKALAIATVKNEIANARDYVPGLEEYIVATTARSDAHLQEEIRSLPRETFSVEIWSWDDINIDLNRLAYVGLEYARHVMIGSDEKVEHEHATYVREALDRPAFLHTGHAERSFVDQRQAVKDTSAFLRTGYLYTRDGRLVSQLPYLRYSEDYSKALATIVDALDAFDSHLGRNMPALLNPHASGHVAARVDSDKKRLRVLQPANRMLRLKGLGDLSPSS